MHHHQEEVSRISFLIRKKINDHLTDTEEKELKSWISQSPKNKELYDRCLNTAEQQQAFRFLQNINVAAAWQDLKLQEEKPQKINSPKLLQIVGYVAACLCIMLTTAVLIRRNQETAPTAQQSVNVDYKPAQNKATIRLSNGKHISLDNNHEAIIIKSNSITYNDGQKVTSTEELTSAQITTPRGGYYKVILPDGTKVQLNAESSMTYPLAFKGDKREVSISGEVYFEVTPARNKPFIVHSSTQVVEVLGTTFNINAYDNSKVKTSLVEGKVKVYSKTNSSLAPKFLTPGQQSICAASNIAVKAIELETELAWIQGKFNFDKKTLKEVMEEISRWYNIDVIIDKDVPNIEFFGGTFRNNNLSTILTLLEQNDISYTLTEDRKLYIKRL
ncbi:FecR family protein [Sphingobacterium thermophilum]|uniref:DUF4974 domain-containing protein n=2 Tax=Sphingobacterium TaxID=28453 RepID=A0ABP8R0Y0_9SPHI